MLRVWSFWGNFSNSSSDERTETNLFKSLGKQLFLLNHRQLGDDPVGILYRWNCWIVCRVGFLMLFKLQSAFNQYFPQIVLSEHVLIQLLIKGLVRKSFLRDLNYFFILISFSEQLPSVPQSLGTIVVANFKGGFIGILADFFSV